MIALRRGGTEVTHEDFMDGEFCCKCVIVLRDDANVRVCVCTPSHLCCRYPRGTGKEEGEPRILRIAQYQVSMKIVSIGNNLSCIAVRLINWDSLRLDRPNYFLCM